ncbi:unnamed protein product [Closterium sp. NIES-53]
MRQQQPRSRETPSAQQLREWYAGRGRSGGVGPCTCVLRTGGRRGETCGLPHTAQRCFGRLTDAWRAQFPDAVELPRWGDLLRQNVAIFDLDFDAILAAMYAVSDSAEGVCYLCVPPDPGIEAAALGASASAAPGTSESAAPGTSESAAPGASESALSVTAPTEALHTSTLDSGASRSFIRDSTILTPLSRLVAVSLADPSGGPVLAHSSTVLACPAAPSGLLSGLHLPSFSVTRDSPLAPPPWSLPPLPPGPAPTCVPCIEGRQRAAPHSSEFPPTEAPLQTLRMDVWGPARVSGQGHERYFLLVVDDYSRYTTVFPLRRKDRGGEFSSDLLRAFCRAEGILQTFTLPASPQKNGIAERCIGMYATHQINLQPRVSLPETTPTLRWTGKVGDASVFRVWGSRAFVRDASADRLSSRAVLCIFLGFPLDAPRWRFYHPTSRRVLSSQDVTFDESVSYYRLFPYRTASLPPPPLFLGPDPSPYKGPRPVLLPPAPSPAVTVSCPTVCAIPGPGQPQVPLALHSQPPVQPPPPLRLHPPPTQASSSLQQPSSASVPKLPSPSMAPSVSSGPISVQAPDLPPMWASLLAPPLPPSSSTPSSAVPQPLAPPHFQLPPSAPCTDPPVVSPILAAPPASVGDQGLQ